MPSMRGNTFHITGPLSGNAAVGYQLTFHPITGVGILYCRNFPQCILYKLKTFWYAFYWMNFDCEINHLNPTLTSKVRCTFTFYITKLLAYKWTYRPSVHSRITLQWLHNRRDGVSNHQPRLCLLNRIFRRRSKKTSKLRVTGLCAGNSPVTGEFPLQMASNAEHVSIWWRHHDLWRTWFRQLHASAHSLNYFDNTVLFDFLYIVSAQYKTICHMLQPLSIFWKKYHRPLYISRYECK